MTGHIGEIMIIVPVTNNKILLKDLSNYLFEEDFTVYPYNEFLRYILFGGNRYDVGKIETLVLNDLLSVIVIWDQQMLNLQHSVKSDIIRLSKELACERIRVLHVNPTDYKPRELSNLIKRELLTKNTTILKLSDNIKFSDGVTVFEVL